MNRKETFIPKKVLERLGFRIAINLIRDYMNTDVLVDISKMKVSMSHVVMTDKDWCLLMSYLKPIMVEQSEKHPNVKTLVEKGEISVNSMFTQIVFVTGGGEITTFAREQGIRMPSYFMQDSRIGLSLGAVTRKPHDPSYINLMHGCVLNERLLHDKFGGEHGVSFFLFYDSFSSSMHRTLFLDMLKDAKMSVTGVIRTATEPIIKVLSNRYVTPTRSHSKSLACYLCRESDNLYTVDVDLNSVFEEILLNAVFLADKATVHNMNVMSSNEIDDWLEKLFEYSIFPEKHRSVPSEFLPMHIEPTTPATAATVETPETPATTETFHDAAEAEGFHSKMSAASLKRPVNPATIEKVQTEPEIAPLKKKKKTDKPKTLFDNVAPAALSHDL